MAISDMFSQNNPNISYDYIKEQEDKQRYTLTDLRNDDEVVKTAERFLKSQGEGESIADLYQYFRGTDWNMADTIKVASKSRKFNEQEIKDYHYLRTKFDNAEIGGFREKARLGVDATQELLTDPVNYISAFLLPWSGGSSVLGRLAGGEAAKLALKEATKLGVRKTLGKTVLNIPGQVLKSPLSKKQILALASADGMVYGGTYNYVHQSIDLNTGRRDNRSYLETARGAAIGAAAGPAVILGFRGAARVPKWVKSVNDRRIARIDHNENYKSNFIEISANKLVEGTKATSDFLKLTTLPLRPTTFLRKKAKENELLQRLLEFIRYDAMEGFIAPAVGKQSRLRKDYNQQLAAFWGGKNERLTKIFIKYDLRSHQNRWTSQELKNWLMNPKLADEVNAELAYFLRTDKTYKVVNGKRVPIKHNILNAGREIRRELDSIYNAAVGAGLKPNRAKNYFPRFWKIGVIRRNKEEFIGKIMRAEGSTRKAAEALWKRLVTDGTSEGSTAAGLSSRLKSERLLTKIKDEEFSKFLSDDVETILRQYFAESSALITRTKLFGETTSDFVKRWINPIIKSGLDLNNKEQLYLKVLYETITGQRGRINRSRKDFFDMIPTGAIGAGIHDTLTVTMQTSMLGLSTLTSLAEIGIPLLLGNEARIGTKAMKNAITDSGAEWWRKQKQNYGFGDANIDYRSVNRQDLNAFMTSVNLAAEDRAVAIYGQAVGKTATKIQNFFFKTIGLHDWTRFVQLVGYDMGKNLIYKNLKTLSTPATRKKMIGYNPETSRKRIRDELSELDIDIDKGLKWIDDGAAHTDDFFMNDVRAGAVRYTNEVVMNPTAASAQKPLVHSLATTKWIYGLLGFPTAFSNGPLRRVVRNITRDAKTMSSGGYRISTARAAAGAIFMTNVGLLNYTLRTGGQNFEDLKSGKVTKDMFWGRVLSYAGILGPAEMFYRYSMGRRYDSLPEAVIGSVVGPNLPDVMDYVTAFWQRGILAETALKRAPFAMSLRSLYPDLYNEALKRARELDKKSPLGREKIKKEEARAVPFFKGGQVSKDYPVPNASLVPSERVDKNSGTGLSYEAPFKPPTLLSEALKNRKAKREGGRITTDPLHRLGFTGGGSIAMEDPLARLGFTGGGGLMVSIGVAPVSEKQISKFEKALKKRKAKRDGGSADIEEIVVKALKRIPQKGKEAYEYAIDKMGENNLDKQFLKEIAYVESKYAEDKGSFRKDNRSAYQITPLAFQEFKETINPNSSRGRGLRAYANKIKDRYDVDISKVTYDELNDPLIGTAVTRALWKLDPEPIGNTVKERANQWKRYWNTEEGKGTVDRYLDDVTFMNK